MNKTFLLSIIFIAILLGCNNKAYSQFFYDSFESQDMNTTNSAGFSWLNLNRTSIVTQHPTDGNVVVFNGNTIYNVVNDARDWTAYNGDYSLRFRYPAEQKWAEQRFNLGAKYLDLWISYWLRVPTNFSQGSQNNKFLSVWVDTYDVSGTVTWQTRPNGTVGGASLVVQDGGVTSGEKQKTLFISVPNDRGRWMHVVAHIKSATTSTANDGLIQLFRRWDGESTYTTIHDMLNTDTYEVGATSQGISNGYLMGWANDPYTVNTEWLIDDFTLSETSLLETVLSVTDETLKNTISMYPIPTSNTFTIDFKNETLEKVIIYNQLGQKVKSLSRQSGKVTTNEVDISNLSNGIYFVKITSESGKMATKKIIKN